MNNIGAKLHKKCLIKKTYNQYFKFKFHIKYLFSKIGFLNIDWKSKTKTSFSANWTVLLTLNSWHCPYSTTAMTTSMPSARNEKCLASLFVGNSLVVHFRKRVELLP